MAPLETQKEVASRSQRREAASRRGEEVSMTFVTGEGVFLTTHSGGLYVARCVGPAWEEDERVVHTHTHTCSPICHPRAGEPSCQGTTILAPFSFLLRLSFCFFHSCQRATFSQFLIAYIFSLLFFTFPFICLSLISFHFLSDSELLDTDKNSRYFHLSLS